MFKNSKNIESKQVQNFHLRDYSFLVCIPDPVHQKNISLVLPRKRIPAYLFYRILVFSKSAI